MKSPTVSDKKTAGGVTPPALGVLTVSPGAMHSRITSTSSPANARRSDVKRTQPFLPGLASLISSVSPTRVRSPL